MRAKIVAMVMKENETSVAWLCRLTPAAGLNPDGQPCLACHRFQSEVSLSNSKLNAHFSRYADFDMPGVK
jgi:hypothetical protein